VAEVGERVTRLEVVAEQTAATLARLERLVEAGFAKVERDLAKVDADLAKVDARAEARSDRNERESKESFEKLDAKIERVRDEVLADNRSNRRLIAWTLLGFFIAALAAIWLTNQLLMQAIDLGRGTAPAASGPASPARPVPSSL
jgi:uncharacterized membrane protein YraQ (UPF0718 family)